MTHIFDLSPREGLTQGDVLAGLSAHGYETVQTFGVVLTARCELAHDKVDLVNYVPVVPLRAWFDREGWRGPAEQEAHQVWQQYASEALHCARSTDLTGNELRTSFDTYGPEACRELIKSAGGKITQKLVELTERYRTLQETLARGERPEGLPVKLVRALLRDLAAHRLADLYYLPLSFLGGDGENPHVALLRQIFALRSEYLCSAEGVAGVRLREHVDGPLPPLCTLAGLPFGRVARLRSPYTEHFLQRLTLLFARIGVEDVDIHNLDRITETLR